MKPLTHRQKRWAEDYLLKGPLRPFAQAAYRGLLGAELAAIARAPRRLDAIDTASVTAVIKTFERPEACRRLVRSLQRHYPGLAIIVVDDSRDPRPLPGATLVSLPFDSGVGPGRQAGLDRVRTPLVLNLDDDFLVYNGTRLGAAMEALRGHPQLDLVGGKVIDLPLFISHDFRGAALFPTKARSRIAPGTQFGAVEVLDKVPNFFLARTEAVRSVGWNPQLKRLDHADFFTRAKGRIVSGMLEEFRVLHLRDPFDAGYRRFRDDVERDRAYLRATYGD